MQLAAARGRKCPAMLGRRDILSFTTRTQEAQCPPARCSNNFSLESAKTFKARSCAGGGHPNGQLQSAALSLLPDRVGQCHLSQKEWTEGVNLQNIQARPGTAKGRCNLGHEQCQHCLASARSDFEGCTLIKPAWNSWPSRGDEHYDWYG